MFIPSLKFVRKLADFLSGGGGGVFGYVPREKFKERVNGRGESPW